MKEKKQSAEKNVSANEKKQNVEQTADEEVKTDGSPEQNDRKDESIDAVEKLEEQLKEQKDLYLRLCAEYDNYKKRTKREVERIGTDTRAEVVKELLPAIDNFSRVMQADENSDEYKKGVEMSIKSFLTVLEKLGVEEIDCQNKTFDPDFHYAVAQIEDDSLEDNAVASVMQKGYKIGDKVIRHAMVSVANCK